MKTCESIGWYKEYVVNDRPNELLNSIIESTNDTVTGLLNQSCSALLWKYPLQ